MLLALEQFADQAGHVADVKVTIPILVEQGVQNPVTFNDPEVTVDLAKN